MDRPSASAGELAQRLLAAEASSPSASDPHVHEAVRVCEKLRAHLTRFIGADGYRALQGRALALARSEVPALNKVAEKSDGSLEGLNELAAESYDVGIESAAAIITHLLSLLVTFIGHSITVRLLREAWPDASLGVHIEESRLP